jgi:hypothetical protein
MALYVQGCPAPLSRKKARQLMRHNQRSLTAPLMAGKGHHKPGPGRYRSHLRNEADWLEQQEQALADKHFMASSVKTALVAIRNLLTRRSTPQRVGLLKASRAS